jgi:hypothetical protein
MQIQSVVGGDNGMGGQDQKKVWGDKNALRRELPSQ